MLHDSFFNTTKHSKLHVAYEFLFYKSHVVSGNVGEEKYH